MSRCRFESCVIGPHHEREVQHKKKSGMSEKWGKSGSREHGEFKDESDGIYNRHGRREAL